MTRGSQPPALKDITLWRWRFYLRHRGYDTSELHEEHWQDFKPVLQDAVLWTGREPKKFHQYKEESDSWQTNVRLAGVDWPEPPHDAGTVIRSLDVRAMLDVFYVESGCAKIGAATPADLLHLKKNQWQAGKSNTSFLGQAASLVAEFERIEEAEARRLSEEMLTQWLEEPPRQVELLKLNFGFVALPVGTADEVCVLLVRSNKTGVSDGLCKRQ